MNYHIKAWRQLTSKRKTYVVFSLILPNSPCIGQSITITISDETTVWFICEWRIGKRPLL